MTKKRAVTALMNWIRSNPAVFAEVLPRRASGKIVLTQFSLTEYSEDGAPWSTVCMEVLPGRPSDLDGWYEIMSRKCSGRLTVDGFDAVGIGECSSVEEMAMKLELAGLGGRKS